MFLSKFARLASLVHIEINIIWDIRKCVQKLGIFEMRTEVCDQRHRDPSDDGRKQRCFCQHVPDLQACSILKIGKYGILENAYKNVGLEKRTEMCDQSHSGPSDNGCKECGFSLTCGRLASLLHFEIKNTGILEIAYTEPRACARRTERTKTSGVTPPR